MSDDTRNESLRDQVATIVQTGYINKKTSAEIADEILNTYFMLPRMAE